MIPEVMIFPLGFLIGMFAFVLFQISGKFADWVTLKILKFFENKGE